jgi:hypothetical protein
MPGLPNIDERLRETSHIKWSHCQYSPVHIWLRCIVYTELICRDVNMQAVIESSQKLPWLWHEYGRLSLYNTAHLWLFPLSSGWIQSIQRNSCDLVCSLPTLQWNSEQASIFSSEIFCMFIEGWCTVVDDVAEFVCQQILQIMIVF